jgi:integrase
VPAESMKQRRPHRVPLNWAALGVLWMMAEAKTWPGPLLVEGRKGALSEAAAGQALAAAGHPDKHPHGLRSTFREWAAETGEPARWRRHRWLMPCRQLPRPISGAICWVRAARSWRGGAPSLSAG